MFDFDSVVDRVGHDATALDGVGKLALASPIEGFDIIPMWVADMNFATPNCVIDSMRRRLDHPYFGYFLPRKELYDGIKRWQKECNNMDVEDENISFDTGVLGGVLSALKVYCNPGEIILVHSPTYIGFTNVFKNNGYFAVHSPLVKDSDGIWRMDFEDMEKKIKSLHIHVMVFCSPHNPSGRVWERWEMEKLSDLCEKYSVELVSDEIWSDIILPGYKHIPLQTVTPYLREHTVACYAPSKTFSIAGLTESYRVVFNKALKDKVDKAASLSHHNDMNLLSMYAHIGACTDDGMAWTDELVKVLGRNVDYAYNFIKTEFKGLDLVKPQGTYLLFVDCTKYCEERGETIDDVFKRAWDHGVAFQDGRPFFGSCHIRMNLALPMSRLEEAFSRMKKYVFI